MSGWMLIWQIFQTWKTEVCAALALAAVVLLIILLIVQRKNLKQNRQLSRQMTGISKQIEGQQNIMQEKPKATPERDNERNRMTGIQRKKEEELFGSVMEEIFS